MSRYTQLRGRRGEREALDNEEDGEERDRRDAHELKLLKDMKANFIKNFRCFRFGWVGAMLVMLATIYYYGVENHPIVAPGPWGGRQKAAGGAPKAIDERDVELKHLLPGGEVTAHECDVIAKHHGMRVGYLDPTGRCQMISAKYHYTLSKPDAADGYELVLLTNQSAVCLDGTPAGYYIKKGDPKRWMVHLQGGGWCVSEADCLERSGAKAPACPAEPSWGHESMMGSSRCWPKQGLPPTDGGGHGIHGGDILKNPDFAHYTKVWAMYCDGGSFSGTKERPVEFEGRELHFKGRAILEATIKNLRDKQGLDVSTHTLLTGTSAGGLALLLALDKVKEILPASQTVAGVVDGGMFVDSVDVSLGPGYTNLFRRVFDMHKSAVHPKCAAEGKTWQCFLSGEAAKHVATPMFLVQSLYDTWQGKNIMHLRCRLDDCQSKAELAALDELRAKTLADSLPIATRPGNGGFLWSCFAHGSVVYDGVWTKGEVDGVSMRDAVTAWWKKVSSGALGMNGGGEFLKQGCKRPCQLFCPPERA